MDTLTLWILYAFSFYYGRSIMNLEFLSKTDKQLEELRFAQTPAGRLARKEIHRRKMVGYCDGTAIDRGFDGDGSPKANPYEVS